MQKQPARALSAATPLHLFGTEEPSGPVCQNCAKDRKPVRIVSALTSPCEDDDREDHEHCKRPPMRESVAMAADEDECRYHEGDHVHRHSPERGGGAWG